MFENFERKYRIFTKQRGYNTFNDLSFHKRGFIDCWAQPGFHRFWHVWNPGIAYFVFQLYLKLGGRKRWVLPTICSFMISGLIHTLVFFLFVWKWSFSVTIAFTCFGILTVISRQMALFLRQDKWHWSLNTAVNIGLVLLSFDLGFRLDRYLVAVL